MSIEIKVILTIGFTIIGGLGLYTFSINKEFADEGRKYHQMIVECNKRTGEICSLHALAADDIIAVSKARKKRNSHYGVYNK